MKLNVDFDPNLDPTWTQVGSMLASKIDQKSLLEARTLPMEPPGPLEIRFSRFGINFPSILDRFLLDFGWILHRLLVVFFIQLFFFL